MKLFHGETEPAYIVVGIMRKEDAMERLRFQQINHQFAFCTRQALQFLHYKSHYIVQEVQYD